MRAKWLLVLSAPLLAAVLAVVLMGSSSGKEKAVDYEALAEKLVNQCAGIHEGDYVLVYGGVRDFELLEDIAVNVRKVGAYPLLMASSERMRHRMYADVPAKYDSTAGKFDEKIYKVIDAAITVSSDEDPSVFADIPPERFATVNGVYGRLNQILLNKKYREISLGNDLNPTKYRAKDFGITVEQLSEVFWKGVGVDYSRLHETGVKVKTALLDGDVLHITNANGTDLTMRIKGRRVFVSDGIVSNDNEAAGTLSCIKFLPAGEVYFTPVPGTVEGKVVVDRRSFLGKEIRKFTMTFVRGKLESMSAESGLEELKKNYDAQPEGKETFGVVDIGINPDVRPVKGSRMVACMASGMISVNVGGNDWAGGDNSTPYAITSYIPGATMTLDGNVLVDKGTLQF